MNYAVAAAILVPCAVVGWFIGARKDMEILGAALGLVLGPIGVAIIAVAVAVTKTPEHPVGRGA
ncbi:MAG: hypothetical protein JWL73_262 [Actinomycetia bacterium]|nr:hypothetical protein [Actinomycetes bacterium]